MMMSSKYTTRNLPMKGLRTCVITLIKILGEFEMPNGITNHSYKPSFVLKAVFHSSPGQILILWKALYRSILEMIVATAIKSNMSSSLKMGKRYFTMILLWLNYPHRFSKIRPFGLGEHALHKDLSFLKQTAFIYLPLQLSMLSGIHPIMRQIWKSFSQNKIYSVLNIAHGL